MASIQSMDHLSAIRSFVEIADKGSLTRATEALDLSRAMISRHLEGLERWLGARRLHRTTRRVSLSEAGQEAPPRLRQMLELAADLQAVSGARQATPRRPEDLQQHECLAHLSGALTEYRLRHAGRLTTLKVKGSLSGNETAVLRQAALAGAGIAMLPTYFVGDDLAQGALVRLLPDHEPEPLGVHAVFLSRQHQPQALKLLVDFLAERFGGDVAPWDRP
jgi:DNA-binding transcriptional LysR family regulator